MGGVASGQPRPVTGAGVVWTGPGSLSGWSLRETAGAVASWRLRNGTTVAGPIVAVGAFVANGSDTVTYYDAHFDVGLYLEVVAGTIEGAILVG